MELLDGGIRPLVEAVRRGDVRPDEVLDATLTRIEERNPALNAVVLVAADRARQRVAAGLPDGPLTGLPYLVKDLHADVAGLPLTRGSRLLDPAPATGSSALVDRLEAAGAVVVGRTNTPEFGLNISTEPARYGATRNPWHLDRSAGGSSGGAAAAVAAGMLPAAHASDSGGSTRIPAAWCGLVGFKPTRGVNPAGPLRVDDWSGLSHEHAVTRSVQDSIRLLRVTAGALPTDPCAAPPFVPLTAPLTRLRVGVITAAAVPVAPVCATAAHGAARALEAAGHRVVPLELPEAAASVGPVMGRVIAGHLAAAVAEVATAEGAASPRLEPAVADLAAQGRGMSAVEQVQAVLALRRLSREIDVLFANVDVVVTPTTAQPAPLLGTLRTDGTAAELFAAIFRIAPFTALFNVTGGPALSVPWGRDEGGCPVGVQLAGRPGRDDVVLALGAVVEQAAPALGRPALTEGPTHV